MIEFLFLLFVGFFASLIDGGLGMGYGPISTSSLLWLGLNTAVVLAAVNLAQAVTSVASAISHIKMRNVDFSVVKHLSIGSIPGGILGTFIVSKYSYLVDIKIVIAVILIGMGLLIIKEAGINQHPKRITEGYYKKPSSKKLWPVGFLGGLCSAMFGSWGPIVLPFLLMDKNHPHIAIGSINTAELIIRCINVLGFILLLKNINFEVSIPLIIGGVLAAPLAAITLKKTQVHIVGWIAGILIILLSVATILKAYL